MIGLDKQNKLFELIGREIKKKIEVMVIGGSAMLFYNFSKTVTKDIDLVAFSETERDHIIKSLSKMGFKIDLKPGKLGEPYRLILEDYIIDVFAKNVFKMKLSDTIKSRVKEKVEYGNIVVSVISPEDIIISKSMTQRKGDRTDAASIIKEMNVNWEIILKECEWQYKNGDKRFAVYLYDFVEELVHEFGIIIEKDVIKKIKSFYREFMEDLDMKK